MRRYTDPVVREVLAHSVNVSLVSTLAPLLLRFISSTARDSHNAASSFPNPHVHAPAPPGGLVARGWGVDRFRRQSSDHGREQLRLHCLASDLPLGRTHAEAEDGVGSEAGIKGRLRSRRVLGRPGLGCQFKSDRALLSGPLLSQKDPAEDATFVCSFLASLPADWM